MIEPTPGPWGVGPYYKHDVHGPTGQLICSAPIDTPQARVNMKAISALPELLAALTECEMFVRVLGLDSEPAAAAAKLARAAIAKAKGKA